MMAMIVVIVMPVMGDDDGIMKANANDDDNDS